MFQKSLTFTFICVICFFVNLTIVKAEDPAPAWLLENSKLATPTFEIKHVPAVVLFNEENITITYNPIYSM